MFLSRVSVSFTFVFVFGSFTLRAQPISVSVLPSQFRVTTFATGLDFVYGLDELSDGSLIAGTSTPNVGGNLFNSVGSLVRFVDADQDGVADGDPNVLFTGLPGVVTAVEVAGDFIFATSSASGQERITVLKPGATPDAPLVAAGVLQFSFPGGSRHTSYALSSRQTPSSPGQIDLFFNVGSFDNVNDSAEGVPVTGLLNLTLNKDAIYKVTVGDGGAGVPVFTNPVQVATGLRNAAGIALHPVTGDRSGK